MDFFDLKIPGKDSESDNQFSIQSTHEQVTDRPHLFSIESFLEECVKRINECELVRFGYSSYISAYDISHDCIRKTLYRLLGYPLPDFRYLWPGLQLRGTIGSAIHEFIQSHYSFTETEVELFVPSLNVSVRLDALIGNNVLVEIKSLPFKDLETIVRSNTPRKHDLLQTVLYKHLLESHLDEIKKATDRRIPKQSRYCIEYIQFIYVAHDIVASDLTLSEALQETKRVRRFLRSKGLDFIFVVTVDGNNVQEEMNYVVKKLSRINEYHRKRVLPDLSDEFVDRKQCGFCPYRDLCIGRG